MLTRVVRVTSNLNQKLDHKTTSFPTAALMIMLPRAAVTLLHFSEKTFDPLFPKLDHKTTSFPKAALMIMVLRAAVTLLHLSAKHLIRYFHLLYTYNYAIQFYKLFQ